MKKRGSFLVLGFSLAAGIWFIAFLLLSSKPSPSTDISSLPTSTVSAVPANIPRPQDALDVGQANIRLPPTPVTRLLSASATPPQPTSVLVPSVTSPPAPIATVDPVHITPPAPIVPNQIVIQFDPNASQEQRAAFIQQIGGTVTQEIDSLNTVIVAIPENIAQESLPTSPTVAISEPDYYVVALDAASLNDPMYPQQWALPVIGAPTAWQTLPADAPIVTVAVIDSGVCLDHPDLAGRIGPGWDFLENDAVPQDDFGHGCAVSGIIAANPNNGIGITGVAPNAQIMPLRVLNGSGIGTYSDVAAAMVYAADNGAQVINLSLGGANPSTVLENAVNYALSKGVTVIAAAGNTGGDILYPARYEPVISVGSVDPDLQRSSFSSYLPTLDLLAPGRDILTTRKDGGFTTMTGTSFAAPHVAGVAVLETVIGRSLTPIGGIVSAGGALIAVPAATATATITPTPTPTLELTQGIITAVDSEAVRVAIGATVDDYLVKQNLPLTYDFRVYGEEIPWIMIILWFLDQNGQPEPMSPITLFGQYLGGDVWLIFAPWNQAIYNEVLNQLPNSVVDAETRNMLRVTELQATVDGVKGGLLFPWQGSGIRYGLNGTHPNTGDGPAIDFLNFTSILAPKDGVVVFADDSVNHPGFTAQQTVNDSNCTMQNVWKANNYVVLGHGRQANDGRYDHYTIYYHLAHGSIPDNLIPSSLNPRPRVRTGQYLGDVGTTGWSTGPHLHFAVGTGVRTSISRVGPNSQYDYYNCYTRTWHTRPSGRDVPFLPDGTRITFDFEEAHWDTVLGWTPGQTISQSSWNRQGLNPNTCNPESDPVIVYMHQDYGGECEKFNVGRDSNLTDNYVGSNTGNSWNDKISSILIQPGNSVLLYEHADFGDSHISLDADTPDFGNINGAYWHDKVSSIDVAFGVCRLSTGEILPQCGEVTPPDTTPPTGSWASPSNGATISSNTVTLSVNASDNSGGSGVKEVRFSAVWPGASWQGIGTDSSAPYSITWDMCSAGVPNGDIDIELGMEVWDNAGNFWIYSQHFTNIHITKNYTCTGSGDPISGSGWETWGWQNRYLAGYDNWHGTVTWENGYPYVWWDFGTGGPFGWGGDDFSLRMQRDVYFPGGHYDFYIEHDDGARVWVDGELIGGAWWDGSSNGSHGMDLSQGNHQVKIEYYEHLGDAFLHVYWYGPGYPRPDNNPPDGRITVPTHLSASNSETLSIWADAWDDASGVNRVEFHAWYCFGSCGWRLIATDYTAPYSHEWPWWILSDQHIWLTIHVYDNTGKLRMDPGGYVEVDLDRVKPSVTIDYPWNDSTLTTNQISIQATASDSHSGIAGLQFFVGYNDVAGASALSQPDLPPPATSLDSFGETGVSEVNAQGWNWREIGWDTNGSDGWSFNWNTSSVPDQQGVAFFIYAYDRAGNYEGAVVWNNRLDRTPPSATFISPTDGSYLTTDQTVIEIDASDNLGGIQVVQFEVGYDPSLAASASQVTGQIWDRYWLGSDSNGSDGWSFTWNAISVADQTGVVFYVTVYDSAGMSTEIISGNHTLDRASPSASIVSPAGGEYLTTDFVLIEADASDSLSGMEGVDFFVGYDPAFAAGAQADVSGTSVEPLPPSLLSEMNSSDIIGQSWDWVWLGTDTDGSDGWNFIWDANTTPDQPDVAFFIYASDYAGNYIGASNWGNVLDRAAPNSAVDNLPATSLPLFTVYWSGADAASGIATYDIQVQIDDGNWIDWLTDVNPVTTSATFAGMVGHMYSFRSRATDYAGHVEPWPDIPDATTTVVILPPVLLNPSDESTTSNRKPVFDWGSVVGAARYEFQLSRDDVESAAVLGASATSYVPQTPLLTTIYCWRVRSVTLEGAVSEWSAAWCVTISAPPGAAPQRNYSTTATPSLSWGRVSWATGYEVQVDSSPSFTTPLDYAVTTASNTLEVTTTPLANGTYYWRVRAKKPDGTWGAWSAADSFIVDVP